MPEPYRTRLRRRASRHADRPACPVEPAPPGDTREALATVLDEQRGETGPRTAHADRRRYGGRHPRQHASLAIDQLAVWRGPQQRRPEAGSRPQLTDRVEIELPATLRWQAQLQRVIAKRHAGRRSAEQHRDASAVAQPAKGEPDRQGRDDQDEE